MNPRACRPCPGWPTSPPNSTTFAPIRQVGTLSISFPLRPERAPVVRCARTWLRMASGPRRPSIVRTSTSSRCCWRSIGCDAADPTRRRSSSPPSGTSACSRSGSNGITPPPPPSSSSNAPGLGPSCGSRTEKSAHHAVRRRTVWVELLLALPLPPSREFLTDPVCLPAGGRCRLQPDPLGSSARWARRSVVAPFQFQQRSVR